MMGEMTRRIVALISVVRDKMTGMAVDAVTEGARIVQTVGEYALEAATETRVALPPWLTERLRKIAGRPPEEPYEFVSAPAGPDGPPAGGGAPAQAARTEQAAAAAAAERTAGSAPPESDGPTGPARPKRAGAKTGPGKRRRGKIAAAKRKPPAGKPSPGDGAGRRRMTKIIDTLLLLALPASGKSEVRRYVASLPPERCRDELHLGPTVQLDDFPYVHLMRRTDDELAARGRDRIFFAAPDRSFVDARDWGTLVELVNDDYAALTAPPRDESRTAAEHLLARIEAAAARTGIPPRLAHIDAATRRDLLGALEPEAAGIARDLNAARPDTLAGRTVVIEFARGGPAGSTMPLREPYGYAYSLSRLSPAILERAAILYVWVTPEESRRKNIERADPNDPGSMLHHGVPEAVMLGDYGCDDMEWLLANSDSPGTVRIDAHGRTFRLPAARFDNRVDLTSFVRRDPSTWTRSETESLLDGLARALATLARK